jgi:hypothetical protein
MKKVHFDKNNLKKRNSIENLGPKISNIQFLKKIFIIKSKARIFLTFIYLLSQNKILG